MENQIDKFLKSCVSTDPFRTALHKPVEVEVTGFIYSTNAHMLVKVPNNITETKYPAEPKFPDCEAVVGMVEKLEKPFLIDTKELKKILSTIPLHNTYAECSHCEGEGTTDCHCCGHYGDCEYCKGSGTTNQITGKEFNNRADKFRIAEGLFDPNYILKIQEAHEIEGGEIKVISNSPNRAMITEVGRMIILIMPQMQDPEAEYTIHELKSLKHYETK